ncbi:MAG: phospholipase C type enzyme [Trizodia sp. TS-e1964]|nr:MAG: phospholipase C type enzyme [Trizodia sp. TS-e1964]
MSSSALDRTLARPSSIHVLSLNCWGLKFISTHHQVRLTAIGAEIASQQPPFEIVGLQECWTQKDYLSIRRQTKHLLPYGKFYHSGPFGGGLAILSRWPIEESSMFRYPLNGRPTAFYRGDWYVGKGVACAKIRIGPAQRDVAEVFCTHFHSTYEPAHRDSYLCHRTSQAWEISKLMSGATQRGHLVIGLGDFNMIPSSLGYDIITTHGHVEDAWRVLHPDSAISAAVDPPEQSRNRPMPTAAFNLAENGTASDSVLITWRWEKSLQKKLDRGEDTFVSKDTPDPRGKRLDYIFVGNDEGEHPPSGWWTVREARVGMTKRHPTLLCSLSDHFSVEAIIAWTPSPHAQEQEAPKSLSPRYLSIDKYDAIINTIESYTAREHHQRRLRLGHFLLQFLIAAGCLVAIWFSPRNFVSFLLMLLSTLGLSAGVVDGLIGGFFMGTELRALKEFEWEMRTLRVAAGGVDDWPDEDQCVQDF